MPDLRAGNVGTIRLTAGLPRTLTFVDLADVLGTSDWEATVDGEELSAAVDGTDVAVSFPADCPSGRFVLAGAGRDEIVGRVVVSQWGTDSPDGTVTVLAAEPEVSVTVLASGSDLGVLTARVAELEAHALLDEEFT